MGEMKVLCDVCGKIAEHTCKMCGKRVCANHFDKKTGCCLDHARGRRI